MIVKPNDLGFCRLLLEMRGSIVPAILPEIIFFTLVGVFACLAFSMDIFGRSTDTLFRLELGPFTALGEYLSLLILITSVFLYSVIDLLTD
jgi:predicted membrane chloride channel (bestrophin family)